MKKSPKVTLAMIVKNEEGGLKRAVDSAKDIVDEVVIGVDTNSTDNTLKIAKEIADVCYEYEWTDDFATARNTYLGKATGDWILQLDGHEYVSKYQDIDWENASKVGDAIRVQILMEDGTTIQADRILKNGIKYLSKIHNYPDVKRPIKDTEFLITHDRSVQTKSAIAIREAQRDKMILENMGNKEDARSLYYTARQHSDMERYDVAIEVYEKYFDVISKMEQTVERTAEKRRVVFHLAKVYYKNGQYKKALKTLDEDLKEYYFLRGQIHAAKRDHPEAIAEFMKSYVSEETGDGFSPVTDIEFQTWDHLSVSLNRMKQYEMAYTAAQKALEYNDDERVKNNARAFANSFKAIKEKGADYYDRLFKDGYDTSRYEDIYEIVLRFLGEIKKPSVLEVGCGVGSLGKLIIDAGYEYSGFDISKNAIKHCKALAGDSFFHVGDLYDKSEFHGDYTVVVATEVLEHVDDLKLLSNIPSGMIFIGSVPNFGDVAHLRTYTDKQKHIVDRFKKYLAVEKILFSEQLGIYVFRGTTK